MGFWTGKTYGQWTKDASERHTENDMDKCDKETLKDGLRYYRKGFNLFQYLFVITFLLCAVFYTNSELYSDSYDNMKERKYNEFKNMEAVKDTNFKNMEANKNAEINLYEKTFTIIGEKECEKIGEKHSGFSEVDGQGVVFHCETQIIAYTR